MMTLNRPLSSLSNAKRPAPSLDTRASLFAPSCTVSRAPAIGVPAVVLTDPDRRHAPFDGSTGFSGWKNSLQAAPAVTMATSSRADIRGTDMLVRALPGLKTRPAKNVVTGGN